ncbi:tetratricopeptide repeat protein [Halobacteriovorax sp. GFR7]|uniref:tetratricopeptide repeat protein n=1 Tax=unclassified Halobacteriovorax TaxID=2639665 RepID=UPI003D97C04C
MKYLLLLLLSTSVFAAKFNVKSDPSDCDVYVIDKNGKRVSLGKTPYETDVETMQTNYGANGPVQIEVYKPGFEPYSLSVPMLAKSDIDISANLKVEKDIELAQDFDFLVGDLFDVLRLMRGKNFDLAFAKLEKLELKFPHFSIIHEMKGSISYLKKDFKNSLAFYRKAFGINPKNREAYKMKIYLEKKFNVSKNEGGK